MSPQLRILLVFGSALAVYFITNKVRKHKILMEDAIFWIVFSGVLLLVAVFPGIAIWCAGTLGFMSPSNFVFLIIMGLLLVKTFMATAEISLLKNRVNELAQEVALQEKAPKQTPPQDKGC